MRKQGTEEQRQLPKNYNEYKLTPVQTLASVVVVGAAGAVVAYIFYMNLYIAAAGFLLGLLGPKLYRQRLIDQRKSALNVQFKDFLYALSSSISAGRSLRDSIITAQQDMRILYMDDQSAIIRELDNMAGQLSMNMRPAELMADFGRRSGNEDIQSFAAVLASGDSKGFDREEQERLVQKTVRVITEKLEVKQEIETKVAAIKMEQRIMLVMPILLVVMMNMMSPDYMQTLYQSPMGYLIVTVAVALLLVAVVVSNKIMNINV